MAAQIRVWSVSFVILAGIATAAPADEARQLDKVGTAELIAQLGSNSFADREAAERELQKRPAAVRLLRGAVNSPSKEVAERAKRILASEIQYAKDLDEAEAQAYLDELLEEIALERETAASRAAK